MLWEIGVSLLEMSQEARRKSCGSGAVTSLVCLIRTSALSSKPTEPKQCDASWLINKPFSISTPGIGLTFNTTRGERKSVTLCCLATFQIDCPASYPLASPWAALLLNNSSTCSFSEHSPEMVSFVGGQSCYIYIYLFFFPYSPCSAKAAEDC